MANGEWLTQSLVLRQTPFDQSVAEFSVRRLKRDDKCRTSIPVSVGWEVNHRPTSPSIPSQLQFRRTQKLKGWIFITGLKNDAKILTWKGFSFTNRRVSFYYFIWRRFSPPFNCKKKYNSFFLFFVIYRMRKKFLFLFFLLLFRCMRI